MITAMKLLASLLLLIPGEGIASRDISLSLSADRATAPPRAGVELWVTVKNVSGRRLDRVIEVSPKAGAVRLLFRRVGGTFVSLDFLDEHIVQDLNGQIMVVDFPSVMGPLAPDAEFTRPAVVLYDSQRGRFLLDAPGDYEFVARHHTQHGTIESNVVSVAVRTPTTPESAAIDDLTAELARIAQAEAPATTFPREATLVAEQFLERHRDTTYADSLRRGLERVLSRRRDLSPAERQLLATVRRQLQLEREGPPRPGKEREAYDQLNSEFMLLAKSRDPELRETLLAMPLPTLIDAGRYAAQWGGTLYGGRVRAGVMFVLEGRARRGLTTPAERDLYRDLQTTREVLPLPAPEPPSTVPPPPPPPAP